MSIQISLDDVRTDEELQQTVATRLMHIMKIAQLPNTERIIHKSNLKSRYFTANKQGRSNPDYDIEVYKAAGLIVESSCFGWMQITEKFVLFLAMELV